MYYKEVQTSNLALNWPAVIKGTVVALAITILGSITLGLSYHFTMLSDKTLPAVADILFYVSILLGSIFAARSAGNKGLLHGMMMALLFIMISIVLGKLFLLAETSFPFIVRKGLLALLVGSTGGILGVSLKK